MGPGYDIYFDCAEDEGYSDDLWLMERCERCRRAAAFGAQAAVSVVPSAPTQQPTGKGRKGRA